MKKEIIYNQELFNKALIFSIKAHKDQVRKFSGKPYIIHPITVMKLLYQFKIRSNNLYMLAIACLLHDTVEDCGITLNQISRLFGYKVVAIVEELSSCKETISKIGKTEYLKNKLVKISSYSLTIKLLDRLDNCSDFSTEHLSWSNKYIKETTEILSHICEFRNLTTTQIKIKNEILLKIRKFTSSI